MKLMVDFNRVDKLGRVPALIPYGQEHELKPGVVVELDDGEGTTCLATVEDWGQTTRFIWVAPQPGTYQRARAAQPA
jgi:hypothetical protein